MNVYPIESEIFPQFFPSRPPEEKPAGHGETILLVDDEEMVRNSVARILRRYNYSVLTTASGVAAIETFRQRQSDIKLVITDVVMPDMNGAALLHVLRILAPNLKAIAISGYAPSSPAVDLLQEDQDHFLAKPFAIAELLVMVRDTLAEAAGKFQVVEGRKAPARRSHLHPKTA